MPLFVGCAGKELAQIAHVADEIDFKAGKTLIREGAPGSEFFVLLQGAAEVTRGGEKIDELGPGDFFGEVALVSEAPRNASVTTTTPVRALVVTTASFRALLEHAPAIESKVRAAVAERSRDG